MEPRRGKDGIAKPDVWTFPFISDGKPEYKRGTYQLAKGVTFAVLAAFRNFVRLDEKRAFWSGSAASTPCSRRGTEVGSEMIVAATDVSQAVNYNPNAVGKNRPRWRQLHQMVASHRLEIEAAELSKDLEAVKAGAKR